MNCLLTRGLLALLYTICLYLTGAHCNGLYDEFDLKIIGGQPIPISQARYQVAIKTLRNGTYVLLCGGTLLRTDLVLTSASCLVGQSRIRVYAGNETLNQQNVFIEPSKIVIHSNYSMVDYPDGDFIRHDIGLIKLKTKFNTGGSIGTIEFATVTPSVNTYCTITGWGSTNGADTDNSNLLMAANVSIHNITDCEDAYTTQVDFQSNTLWNQTICASGTNGGKDICLGDFGGSLVCNNTVVGIDLKSVCGDLNTFPVRFTDVTKYAEWIIENSSGGLGTNNYVLLISMMFTIIYYEYL